MSDESDESKSKEEPAGRAFERVTAAIQQKMDPSASVEHYVLLTDRLGQERQFDVVFRGNFGGHPMLGVIECKDYAKKIGTPEVDAFVTKSADVNANFKVLVSRSGFSKPALAKCQFYGIKAFSLVAGDPANRKFFLGSYWDADVINWDRVEMVLHPVGNIPIPDGYAIGDVSIGGKRLLDWFTNYILDHEHEVQGEGWVIDLVVVFREPQLVSTGGEAASVCAAVSFMAERVRHEFQRRVGISGPGFVDWHTGKATFPGGVQISTEAVPLDFKQWESRAREGRAQTGFVEVFMTAISDQFDRVEGTIDLESLGEIAHRAVVMTDNSEI